MEPLPSQGAQGHNKSDSFMKRITVAMGISDLDTEMLKETASLLNQMSGPL